MNPPESAGGPLWYCVRTLVKRESLAARHIRRSGRVEVFAPRIRFRRATRRGAIWFEEALFPGYLFARFDMQRESGFVQYAAGVRGLVRFGRVPAAVSGPVIEDLRRAMEGRELKIFEETLRPGDRALILEGPFQGLEAVVRAVLPASDRIRVLFEFLGRPTEMVVDRRGLMPAESRSHPLRHGGSAGRRP